MKDLKRTNQFYKTQLCPWHKLGKCYMHKECNFAHSNEELRCKPNLIKTKMCPRLQKGFCDDINCQYSHDIHELRVTEYFFKSKICQYWLNSNCKRGQNCRYAHGIEEIKNNNDETLSAANSLISTKDMLSTSSMDYESSFNSSQPEHKLNSPSEFYRPCYAIFPQEKHPITILIPSNQAEQYYNYYNQPDFYPAFPFNNFSLS